MAEDSAWLSALRQGDREAQRLCYEEHAPRLLAVIHAVVQDADAASDVLHDSFLKAFAGIASFRGDSQFSTWLHRLAVNEALQHLRRRKRMPVPLPDGVTAATLNGPDTSDDVESLQAAMASLSPEYRLILLMKYRDGLDYAQIADQLGVASGTVASRLNRARAELKEIMNGDLSAEETPSAGHPRNRAGFPAAPVPINPAAEGLP